MALESAQSGPLHEGAVRTAPLTAGSGRRRPPLIVVLVLAIAGTVVLALLARYSQALQPSPPLISMIVGVPVFIDTVPPGAAVIVDEHDTGTTPLRASLPVGVHTLDFRRDGFADLRRRIELVPGSPLSIKLPLVPLPGSIRVLTDAPEAEVAVDGHPLDGQEFEFIADDVAPGKHTLAISSTKAHASLSFEMKPGARPVLNGPPRTRDLKIAVISRFADSGTVVGSEDAKIGLTHGPVVEAAPDPQPLPIADGENAELLGTGLGRRTVPLNHAAVPSLSVIAAFESGSLVVTTGADDAVVWINGRMSRRQPQNGRLYFWGLTPGDYEIRAARPSGAAKSVKVTVAKDEQTQVALPLTSAQSGAPRAVAPAPAVKARPHGTGPVNAAPAVVSPPRLVAGPQGLARFIIRTPGAHLTIRRVDIQDSQNRVVDANFLWLPAGRWMVHATAPGFEPYTGSFLVNQAGPADVFIRLQPAARESK